MKITVVHGTMRRQSTYHCVKLIIDAIAARVGASEIEVAEFFLPRDMQHYCCGCFTCFLKGEQGCPHADSVQPIVSELDQADLIILDSPAYVCDVSGQMKTFLDHMGYRWMPHRPEGSMFGKIGLVVSTAAGAGTRHTNKTMKSSLKYWGVRRIFALGPAVGAMNWDGVKPEKKKQIEKKAGSLAGKIVYAYRSSNHKPPLFTRFLFALMTKMQKGNDWNPTDRGHWEKQGWLGGKKPW
jgi:multimeric flavodoxin WrbA